MSFGSLLLVSTCVRACVRESHLAISRRFYKVGLSWTLLPDGRGARYALRAETDGYVSFAWVNADWPVTDDFQYEGKMYGADGVFGWFDEDGVGHVESYVRALARLCLP